MMEIVLTILSYILAGGIGSVIAAVITVKATKRGALAEAMRKEEEAEKLAIENTERWRVSYGNIITDLTEKLERMLKINNEMEDKYHGLEVKYSELERKYTELETKYERIKNQQYYSANRTIGSVK